MNPHSFEFILRDELRLHGFNTDIQVSNGRLVIDEEHARTVVNIEKLEGVFAGDSNRQRVARFVEITLASSLVLAGPIRAERLYWNLERNDCEIPAAFRVALSDRIDRVLVYLSEDERVASWVTPAVLESVELTEAEAGALAFENLDKALATAKLDSDLVGNASLDFFSTGFALDSSLLLAPSLSRIYGKGPVRAAAPSRHIHYLWPPALEPEVMDELTRAILWRYQGERQPLSTDIYEISDEGIRWDSATILDFG